jgi:hypothetical protein
MSASVWPIKAERMDWREYEIYFRTVKGWSAQEHRSVHIVLYVSQLWIVASSPNLACVLRDRTRSTQTQQGIVKDLVGQPKALNFGSQFAEVFAASCPRRVMVLVSTRQISLPVGFLSGAVLIDRTSLRHSANLLSPLPGAFQCLSPLQGGHTPSLCFSALAFLRCTLIVALSLSLSLSISLALAVTRCALTLVMLFGSRSDAVHIHCRSLSP